MENPPENIFPSTLKWVKTNQTGLGDATMKNHPSWIFSNENLLSFGYTYFLDPNPPGTTHGSRHLQPPEAPSVRGRGAGVAPGRRGGRGGLDGAQSYGGAVAAVLQGPNGGEEWVGTVGTVQ